MKVTDLRGVFEAGRPLVQQWLDIAEQMAALRDACREKEIDWSQVKSLLKAQVQDSIEGTDKRVKAILDRADNATSYADALGLGRPEKKISREIEPKEPQPRIATEKPTGAIEPSPAVMRPAAEIPAPARAIPDDLSIPDFLVRSA